MELSQEALLPLAILVTLIYEGKDEELINVANELISQKAKLKDSNEKLNPNHYAVKAIQLKEPFLIEELREGTVEGKDLRVKFRLNDIKILDVGEFTTKKEKECCVSLEFDYVKISGVYSISGSVYEQQFSGGGRADITLKQVSSEARVDHTLDEDEEPRIDRLHFDFDFKFLEFEQTGLAIKDVPNSEVKRILNSVGKLYFKQNMKTVSRKLSDSIKSRLNDILKEERVLKSLIPIAILSKLVFGDEEEKFFNELHELGILHFRDNTPANVPSLTSNSSKGRQLTRAISINANGKVEVERQFSNGIEKFTVSAKTKDPIKLESLDKEIFVLKEKDIKLDFQLRNVQLYDINNYVIKGIKSMGHDEWARIHFDLPEIMKLTCRYHIFGMMAGRNVNEGGTAVMRLRGVKVEGRVKVDVTDESMRIDNMDLQYSFQDLSIEKIGLIIAGMSKEQINQLFNDAGKKYLQENLPLVAERLSAEIKTKLNERLKDLTGAKLIRTVRQKGFQDEDEILDSYK